MPMFETLAATCAPMLALDLLVGIAWVESGLQPLAVGDGTRVEIARSAGEAVASVVGGMDAGREYRAGLMGISEKQLRGIGIALGDAFTACGSLRAAQSLFLAQRDAAAQRGVADVLLARVAVRSFWRPDGRFVSGAAYEAAVLEAASRARELGRTEIAGSLPAVAATSVQKQSIRAASTAKDRLDSAGHGPLAQQRSQGRDGLSTRDVVSGPSREPEEVPSWDVFGRARGSSGAVIYQRRD
jgi:type IV secretion system protein VirB1